MTAVIPITAQYSANQISLPLRTSASIHLQATTPDRNAAKNPATSELKGIWVPEVNSPPIKSKMASPKMGIMTIKKEN